LIAKEGDGQMPVKIKSIETAPNGTVSVKLSFPDSELDKFLQWYASGNGKSQPATRGRKRRSASASRRAVATRRKNQKAKQGTAAR